MRLTRGTSFMGAISVENRSLSATSPSSSASSWLLPVSEPYKQRSDLAFSSCWSAPSSSMVHGYLSARQYKHVAGFPKKGKLPRR